jgi:hypothetical protein
MINDQKIYTATMSALLPPAIQRKRRSTLREYGEARKEIELEREMPAETAPKPGEDKGGYDIAEGR